MLINVLEYHLKPFLLLVPNFHRCQVFLKGFVHKRIAILPLKAQQSCSVSNNLLQEAFGLCLGLMTLYIFHLSDILRQLRNQFIPVNQRTAFGIPCTALAMNPIGKTFHQPPQVI